MAKPEANQAELERGRDEARSDIEAARPRFFWGTRGEWGLFLEELFRTRFGVEVEHSDCFVSPGLVSYREGYNSTVIAHIDGKYGAGAFARAREEVERFRKESHARKLHPRA